MKCIINVIKTYNMCDLLLVKYYLDIVSLVWYFLVDTGRETAAKQVIITIQMLRVYTRKPSVC